MRHMPPIITDVGARLGADHDYNRNRLFSITTFHVIIIASIINILNSVIIIVIIPIQ